MTRNSPTNGNMNSQDATNVAIPEATQRKQLITIRAFTVVILAGFKAFGLMVANMGRYLDRPVDL
ncbi:MAG TPA: hypothetical protein DCL77_14645 [Prolixibacteraceae bacterium]|nr:hypothetical protein [Prolixibacteraceae bacterium]